MGSEVSEEHIIYIFRKFSKLVQFYTEDGGNGFVENVNTQYTVL
jgi:hypothetical protein